MSLIPSSVQGAAGDNYFTEVDGGVARNLTILPLSSGIPGTSAVLGINNAVTDPSGSPMSVAHYVSSVAGGGLVPGQYQVYMYGPSIGGNNIGELFMGQGLGNNSTSLLFNNGGPLDTARIGKITGTGAAQVIAVPSILGSSIVQLAFVGGTPAGADVGIVITPNTNFSLTLPAGCVMNYQVMG